MTIQEILKYQNFAIIGDTLNEQKFAYKIKHAMKQNGYTVHCVGKELNSLNDIEANIDIIDLCIHPAKGLKLIQESKKTYKHIIIQPGAESEELLQYLQANHIPYIQDCLWLGLQQKNQD